MKRFKIELKNERVKQSLITEHKDSKLAIFSSRKEAFVAHTYLKGKEKEKIETEAKLSDIIDVKGWKTLGNRLTQFPVSGKITETVYEDEVVEKNKEESESATGKTVEWDLNTNPKAGKSGKQGGLF